MATKKAGFEFGKAYTVKGVLASFVESAKGWHLFKDAIDGKDIKARAKDVKAVSAANPDGSPPTDGQRVFRTFDPETGDVNRQAVFKMDHYTRHTEESTEGGFHPLDISDATADSLRGLGIEEQFEEAARIVRSYRDDKWEGTKTEIEQEMRDRYSKLNPGQIRMNLGNIIRGCSNRAEREAALDAELGKVKA